MRLTVSAEDELGVHDLALDLVEIFRVKMGQLDLPTLSISPTTTHEQLTLTGWDSGSSSSAWLVESSMDMGTTGRSTSTFMVRIESRKIFSIAPW